MAWQGTFSVEYIAQSSPSTSLVLGQHGRTVWWRVAPNICDLQAGNLPGFTAACARLPYSRLQARRIVCHKNCTHPGFQCNRRPQCAKSARQLRHPQPTGKHRDSILVQACGAAESRAHVAPCQQLLCLPGGRKEMACHPLSCTKVVLPRNGANRRRPFQQPTAVY